MVVAVDCSDSLLGGQLIFVKVLASPLVEIVVCVANRLVARHDDFGCDCDDWREAIWIVMVTQISYLLVKWGC